MVTASMALSRHARNQVEYQVRRTRYRGADAEDLRQELFLRLVESVPNYDRRLGAPEAFASKVLTRGAARHYRDRNAGMRAGRPRSLDDLLTDSPCTAFDRTADLRVDLLRVLAMLPVPLLQVTLILAMHTPTEAAWQLGIACSTVHRRMLKVRRLFILYGLHTYLSDVEGGVE